MPDVAPRIAVWDMAIAVRDVANRVELGREVVNLLVKLRTPTVLGQARTPHRFRTHFGMPSDLFGHDQINCEAKA